MKLNSALGTFVAGLTLLCQRGVADATPAISGPTEVDVPSNHNVICLVSLTAFMRRLADGTEASDHRYDCLALTTYGPHEVHLNFGPNSLVQRENERAMAKGEWLISFPVEWVDNENRLLPHKMELVKTLSPFEVEMAMLQIHRHGGRKLLRDVLNKSDATRLRRRRLGAIGEQDCGIVIVNTRDKSNKETTSSVERAVYTTASNQFRTCSNNAMSLRRKDATISVTLPRDLRSYNSQTVYDAARAAVCAYYGQPQHCEPATVRDLDHILYSIPFGTSDDQAGYNWAYASIGGTRRMSIYNGGYFSPSTIMHELAHNYMLGHAVEGNDPYGDQTGQMGGGGTNMRCFNGYNMYVLGWLSHQTASINSSNPPPYGRTVEYTLKSLADMRSGGFVNLKLGQFYLVYNMDKGMNAETREYKDQVLVHRGKDITFGDSSFSNHADTHLLGALSKVGDRIEIANFRGRDSLVVEVCSMDKVGSHGVRLVVGTNQASCGTVVLQKIRGGNQDSPMTTTQHVSSKTDGASSFIFLNEQQDSTPNTILRLDAKVASQEVGGDYVNAALEEKDGNSSVAYSSSSSSSSSLSSTLASTAVSFDIRCDNLWKSTVQIEGLQSERTCEWIYQHASEFCDAPMASSATNGGGGIGDPVKQKCQVQCLPEACAYAAICRRRGDQCSNGSGSGSNENESEGTTQNITSCCDSLQCVDGICVAGSEG